MKILVYGAGVLGSYAAYELKMAGHEVTILARGKRYEELKEKGLVIRHYLQRKTTVDKVNIVKELLPCDQYDVTFVVMQALQVQDVLPAISKNIKCPLFVFVGNQDKAREINLKIKNTSAGNPRVIFGFFSVGGRREDGKIISVHMRHSDFDVGDLEGGKDYKSTMEKIFDKTGFKVHYHGNMDDFFKTHIAFIMPLAYLVYMSDCDLRKIAGNKKVLNSAIDAIIEGCSVLDGLGYKIDPEGSYSLIKKHRKIVYFGLKICALTPLGILAITDHCKAGWREMQKLDRALLNWTEESKILTPNLNNLRKYLVEYVQRKNI